MFARFLLCYVAILCFVELSFAMRSVNFEMKMKIIRRMIHFCNHL